MSGFTHLGALAGIATRYDTSVRGIRILDKVLGDRHFVLEFLDGLSSWLFLSINWMEECRDTGRK